MFSPVRAVWPAHFVLRGLICNNIWQGFVLCSSSLCSAECYQSLVGMIQSHSHLRLLDDIFQGGRDRRISPALRSGFGCIWIKDYTAFLTTWTWVPGHDSVQEATEVNVVGITRHRLFEKNLPQFGERIRDLFFLTFTFNRLW
jgi:hypothetical protein